MDIAAKLSEILKGVALAEVEQRVREAVEALLAQFLVEAKSQFESNYHELLNVNVRQNIAAYSNERVAELAGFVNAEIARRAA